MRLNSNLVLVSFLSELLGGTPEELVSLLSQADEGRRPDGQSNFYGVLESRRTRLKLNLDDLKRYDLNILTHEKALAAHRASFRLKYFQYLAALFTEIYLHRFATNPASLLLDLDTHRAAKFSALPAYAASDMRKLAFFMATGAGKTLVMHVNMRQFLHYRLFTPDSIIVVTPTATLAQQHLNDLEESGIEAKYALDAPPGFNGVLVLEIQKLYVEREAATAKGGVSIPTSQFSGRNLLLVDEGHKGSATKTEQKTERSWRDIREHLVGAEGFTFEYSATFAQVTDSDDALFGEYARSIIFEYAYRRFHQDGYGKDFRIINLAKHQDSQSGTLLMAGLLTFYEKRRLYDDQVVQLRPYNIEPPLLVFVGAQVSAGPEVLAIIKFLNQLVSDRGWAIATIGKILRGQSGLPGQGDQDPFLNAFTYLKGLGLSDEGLYTDLCRRLLRGVGRLSLHLLRSADGEIGIRTADSTHEAYFGVVNVGDAPKFLKKVKAEEPTISVGDDDYITGSLFEAINQPNSEINVLVGSKKFIEGWSSWRVSVMGLLKVGTSAGAQVIQLFGRGVRLKGFAMSLQRTEASTGTHPRQIRQMETLHIFGLKSDYLANFLLRLEKEDLAQTEVRYLPLEIQSRAISAAELKALAVDPGKRFADKIMRFEPAGINVSVDLNPRMVFSDAASAESATSRYEAERLPAAALARLPYETLYDYALTLKRQKGWDNIYISREAVRRFFAVSARIAAPPEVLAPQRPEDLATLEQAAQSLLRSGIERFQYASQQRFETEHLQVTTLTEDHPNFPRIGETPATYAYELRIPSNLLAAVDAIISSAAERMMEESIQPLPRLYVDFHLFNPLLLLPPKGVNGVKSTPPGLEPSERTFVKDLRDYWQSAVTQQAWERCELYLLRNLPLSGVGFFETAGFYPDFLLWLKRDGRQVLAFVDPKGLTRWNEEKVTLLDYIRKQSVRVGLDMVAYIVTPTNEESLQVPGTSAATKVAALKRRHVLIQEELDYIPTMLEEMRGLL